MDTVSDQFNSLIGFNLNDYTNSYHFFRVFMLSGNLQLKSSVKGNKSLCHFDLPPILS